MLTLGAVEKTHWISYSWLQNEGLPFAIDLLSRDTVVVYFANGRHPTPLVSETVTPGRHGNRRL